MWIALAWGTLHFSLLRHSHKIFRTGRRRRNVTSLCNVLTPYGCEIPEVIGQNATATRTNLPGITDLSLCHGVEVGDKCESVAMAGCLVNTTRLMTIELGTAALSARHTTKSSRESNVACEDFMPVEEATDSKLHNQFKRSHAGSAAGRGHNNISILSQQ